jgi:hypothetical protein
MRTRCGAWLLALRLLDALAQSSHWYPSVHSTVMYLGLA